MKKLFILAGILLSHFLHAQTSDSTRSAPMTTVPRLGGVTISDQIAPIKADGNTLLMQLPVVDIGIPLYKDFSTVHAVLIKTGIHYEGLLLTNEKHIGSSSFQALSVPLLASYSFNRTTNVTFIGLATAGSDFKKSITANDLFYTVGIRIGFQPTRSLRYGVTLTYISNYSGKFVLPLPDIDWAISKKWTFTAYVPVRASLKYALDRRQSIGATTGYMGGMYRLNDGLGDQYLNLQQYTAGLLYDLKLGSRWKVNLIAGHTLMQKLQTFNMDQTVPFEGLGKLNDRKANVSYEQQSFVLQVGISYLF
jgi:hypothetical protein